MAQTTVELETELEPQHDPSPVGSSPPAPPAPSGNWGQVARFSLMCGLSILAAANMAGGLFEGFAPRIVAALAGLAGIAIAIAGYSIKRPLVANATIAIALFLTGLVLVLPTGLANVPGIGDRVVEAVSSRSVLRPPVEFLPGWHALLVWLMAIFGFAAGWSAIAVARPALGIFIPLTVVAVAAISVPERQRIPSGIASLIFFAGSLAVLSSQNVGTDGTAALSFTLRRAVRGIPLVAAICVALILMSRANLLFPDPLFDPAEEARKPKPIPLTEVPDRVLFTVESTISGPWRMGLLDVYDGKDWRLPPFAQSRFRDVPTSGVLDADLEPGHVASFEIKALQGAVVPGLPNLVGVSAQGDLVYDLRTGNIRFSEGQVTFGTKYAVSAARLPSVEELQQVSGPLPKSVLPFVEIPPPPPAVKNLLDQAPATSAWDRFDFVRRTFLSTVVATGTGTPKSVPPQRVDDMIAGSKEGSPFEIVAGQALLARWSGLPSRIGYGFDAGNQVAEGVYEVRPKHGVTFIEVYFPGYKWLPVLGNPAQAKSSTSDNEQTLTNIRPSNEIAIEVYLPTFQSPENFLFLQIRRIVLIALPIVLFLLLAYFSYPAVKKLILKTRRRTRAQSEGIESRIALAYSEWRDLATDFGYRFESDTPLMFTNRVISDAEHSTLAWLVTLTLWGDLQHELTTEDALNAEELSRTLGKRLSQAHPWTLRLLAAVSRLSLRHPYAPSPSPATHRRSKREVSHAA